jgi:hypothetical protein
MATRIYKNDIGTEFIFDCGVSITDATDTSVVITKPDGTDVTWIAVKHSINGEENYLKYNSVAGDLNQLGVYTSDTELVFPTWQGSADPTIFTVWDKSEIIKIHEKYLEEIKDLTAFPIVDNIILTDNQIREVCVRPALRDYFTKFPIKVPEEQNISGAEIVVDFPDEYTYGVVDVRILASGSSSGSGSSWFELLRWQNIGGGKSSNKYGIPGYNPGHIMQANLDSMQAHQSMINQYTTLKYRVEPHNKKVYAYTNGSGKLNITWAKYSNEFNAVEYSKINDVIKLCRANLLLHLGMASNMIEDGSEIDVNSDLLIDTAKEIREEVFEKWEQYPDIIVLHAK